MTRLCALGALLGAILLLSACDDPTDVGGELIDRPDVGPERVELPIEIEPASYVPITGAASPIALSVSRVLAGRSDEDPFPGTEATGYVDFVRSGTNSDADLSGLTLDSVEVQLTPDYFYGDTTRATSFALYDVEEEWDIGSGRADTSFSEIAESNPITTFSAAPSDTLVTVPLPAGWQREHAEELLAETDSAFAEVFHGFQIRPLDGERGVVGFSSSLVSMRAVLREEGEDEERQVVSYSAARILTTIQQSSPPTLPEDRFLLQGGVGRALAFEFEFPDSLRSVSVNSAEVIFEVDSTFASAEGFARPRLDALDLFGILLDDDGAPDEDEDPFVLQYSPITFDAAESEFTNRLSFISLIQELVLGISEAERFQLRPPAQQVQLGPNQAVPVSVPSFDSRIIRRDPGHQPRLVLTYTPTDQ